MGFFTRAAMDALMKTTHPEINRRQCWNLHPHRKSCTACKDICPYGDQIFTRPNLVKDWDPCTDCGLCVSVCRSRCISPSPEQVERDTSAADTDNDTIWIGCEKSARKNSMVRACIASLSWEALAYLGETLCALPHLFSGRFRWGDCRLTFVRCGVQAVPVMLLIGFLLGLILAFQSAIPLKLFGGEGFVGGLVGIALIRELGVLVGAILMAGRSGSAFAAELGAMRVNEEIDALETMGLRPVRFLVLPRVVAGTLALPLLSLFVSFAGLVGGGLVMGVLGFSESYYIRQLQTFVHLNDILGSFCKAFVFGFAVSAVGCWFGLKAGRDAGAVGTATTAAVVTGIVTIAVLEGIFSVVFYAMGW